MCLRGCWATRLSKSEIVTAKNKSPKKSKLNKASTKPPHHKRRKRVNSLPKLNQSLSSLTLTAKITNKLLLRKRRLRKYPMIYLWCCREAYWLWLKSLIVLSRQWLQKSIRSKRATKNWRPKWFDYLILRWRLNLMLKINSDLKPFLPNN